MYIGRSFYLRDFDSSDQPGTEFNVSLTLMQAVDGIEEEGLLFNTAGTGVSVYPSVIDQYTFQYVLAGGSNYSEYQQVSIGKKCTELAACSIMCFYSLSFI